MLIDSVKFHETTLHVAGKWCAVEYLGKHRLCCFPLCWKQHVSVWDFKRQCKAQGNLALEDLSLEW